VFHYFFVKLPPSPSPMLGGMSVCYMKCLPEAVILQQHWLKQGEREGAINWNQHIIEKRIVITCQLVLAKIVPCKYDWIRYERIWTYTVCFIHMSNFKFEKRNIFFDANTKSCLIAAWLVAWLHVCLVAWLLGCLIAWLLSCLLACLVAWLLSCLLACLVAWLLVC